MKPNDDNKPRTHVGKIARLPAEIREELNQKILDGETGRELVVWLNGLDSVKAIVAARFRGVAISESNLSQWRLGGFRDWLETDAKVSATKKLADHALKLGLAAGGKLTDGSAAIAGGKILSMMESANNDEIGELIDSLVKLRRTDLAKERLKIASRRADQLDEKGELEKMKFAALALDLLANKAAADIAAGKDERPVKMEKLVELMFGRQPKLAPVTV